MDEVFNTTELLETILIELPPRDLLISQRVGTRFRDTIRGSIRLQRALFIVAQPAAGSDDQSDLRQTVLNATIAEMINQHKVVYFKASDKYLGVSDLSARNVRHDPSQTVLCVRLTVSERRYSTTPDMKVCMPGSWEDMFICSPAHMVWVNMKKSRLISKPGGWVEKGFEMQTKMGELMKEAASCGDVGGSQRVAVRSGAKKLEFRYYGKAT